jgi:hypothetical protein
MTKEEARKFMLNTPPHEIEKRLLEMSDEEALETVRYMDEIAKELPIYKSDPVFRKNVIEAQKAANALEDTIAAEKVQMLKNEVQMDAAIKEAEKSFENVRKELIKGIMEGKVELKEVAKGIIKIERENNLFEPKNWKGLEELF